MTSIPLTARPQLITRRFARVLVVVFGSSLNFYLLISVVPLYLARSGWSEAGAGLAVAAMMAAIVVVEIVVPVLAARFGYRVLVVTGLLLLALPSLLLLASTVTAVVLLVSVARGAGLAVMFVGNAALVATVVPRDRRGMALGVAGAVSTVPAVLGLPLGVQLAQRYGFEPVFGLATLCALAALTVVRGLPRSAADRVAGGDGPVAVLRGLGCGGLRRPVIVFGVVAMGGGMIATFLPLAVSGTLAPVALFVQAVGAPVARILAGRYGDRRGHGGLLVPSVLVSALGAAGLVWLHNPVAVIAGMALFGLGFGTAQNAALSVMFGRVGPSGYGRVSALWNAAYDAGWGLGALSVGVLAGHTGYPVAFGIVALGIVAVALPAYRDRTGPAPVGEPGPAAQPPSTV